MRTALKDAEVDELWTKWTKDHARDVRDQLICHYLPTVEFLAARLAPHVPQSYRPDLYGFGVIGLMDAIEKFKPELGNRFGTYASQRIRGAMSDGIRTLNWLPRGAEKRASRVIEKIVPVDFKAARTSFGGSLEDTVSERGEVTPLELLELEADYAEVAEAVGDLREQERKVIIDIYYHRRKLAEIAVELGVTESRVCQIHRRALKLLEGILLQRRSA
jgi:RNA polymerase sigma factor for flagellar operon FliA